LRLARTCSLALLVALPLVPCPVAAQLEPPGTGGIVALDRELRMLGHYRRVLMIGAHPDDEDTELLTVLVRGMGAEAAYLSLNRGEGGQNLIGPELGEALGLIRTEELLAARQLDGARQYFTRAYDFGYSKSLDETWEHWPSDTILKDVVRIVRRFRPQIIVSTFSGEPRDGHGQHQAAGWAAREAFAAAGDSTRFPELAREEGLRPWTPLKLYRSTRFDSAATTLTLDGGVLDRAVGKSYHQIAMASRSLHRSQDMGRLQTIGPSEVPLALLEDRTAEGSDGLFAGIDTSLSAMPWRDAPGTDGPAARRRFAARADSARAALGTGAFGASATCRPNRTTAALSCCSRPPSRGTSGGTPSARSGSRRDWWPTRWRTTTAWSPARRTASISWSGTGARTP
jgi:LmbE family N-acetylglucosaminyl deacetylase